MLDVVQLGQVLILQICARKKKQQQKQTNGEQGAGTIHTDASDVVHWPFDNDDVDDDHALVTRPIFFFSLYVCVCVCMSISVKESQQFHSIGLNLQAQHNTTQRHQNPKIKRTTFIAEDS